MKAVILAGGFGTRISEESQVTPKPMIAIGGRPILWHIMKLYSHYGINDFVICLGYKGYVIKEYFINYFLHTSDVRVHLDQGKVDVLHKRGESWSVTLVDTGEKTLTGGRLKRVRDYVGDEDFCFTYGDGVADIEIDKLVAFHKNHGKLATVTAVRPPGRYGALAIAKGGTVTSLVEKPPGDGGHINGGYFVLSPKVMDFIDGDATSWETEPLNKLAATGQLVAYEHRGFWQAMDTLRDKHQLEEMYAGGNARWKIWD